MPKLWLPNKEDAFFGLNTYPTINHTSKYIWSVGKNDIFISPIPIQKELLEYIGKIKGFDLIDRIVTLEKFSAPYSIVESLLSHPERMKHIKQLTQKGDWQLEPYIQSKPAVKLSKALDIPINGTADNLILSGLTEALNCKSDFKNLCRRIGIQTVPGYLANNLEELQDAIDQVSRENNDRIILKKSKALGGRGNRVGNKDSLKQNLEQWYSQNEKVVVEHFLDFEESIGALAIAKKLKAEFIDINKHIIQNYLWKGFQYPFKHLLNTLIKEKTLTFAKHVQHEGGRGFINIDYGICKGQIYALECNFRHTGFSFLYDTFLNSHQAKRNLCYLDGLPLSKKEDFLSLKNKLQKISYKGQPVFIDKPEQNQGLIIINMTPDANTYGAAVYSDNAEYVRDVFNLVQHRNRPYSLSKPADLTDSGLAR